MELTINNIEKLLEAKLGPIKNDLYTVKLHRESINNRLSKIEDRMANVELCIDRVAHTAIQRI